MTAFTGGNANNLTTLYLNDNRLSEGISEYAFSRMNKLQTLYLYNNRLHDLPSDMPASVTSFSPYYNCFGTRDTSPAAITYLETKYSSSRESNQYLCIKDVTYDPPRPLSGTVAEPVEATVTFYGPLSRETQMLSSYGQYFSRTFFDNGSYTGDLTNTSINYFQ